MTNEQLARLIQQGDNDELIPVLWEKVRRLVYVLANRAYRQWLNVYQARGVEEWDVKQAFYFAFLSAIKGFDAGSGNKFISYLKFPSLTEATKLAGKIKHRKIDALDHSFSLDVNYSDSSEEDETTPLESALEDPGAEKDFYSLETSDFSHYARGVIEKALILLSERQRDALRLVYYDNLSYADAGRKLGVSGQNVSQLCKEGCHYLRKCSYRHQLRNLLESYTEQNNLFAHAGYGAYMGYGASSVEIYAESRL